MLEFSPSKPAAIAAMETAVATDWGTATARYFQGHGASYWLAFVNYAFADGTEIHRPSPRFETSTDARDWIEAAITEGPSFVLAVVGAGASV